MAEREKLEQAIDHLETQRATLGDAVVDASIAALRQQLAALEPPPSTELQRKQAIEQQRKQVTVLFADVSGFTAMSETMDAEDVTEVINALWERLDGVIVEHGGFIDKHMGDAVMALWGAETAREDDPERAIHAALAVQAELAAFREERQVDLAMRIGVNTGPVLLGEVGTTGEYTAMGDAVNVASRLEHTAPLGGVLTSHDTYRHVRGVFDVQVMEPVQVRGKAEPIQVYLVERAKPRAFRKGTRGVEGIETRMIGREAELECLQDAFRAAMEQGKRQMVTIAGEAGVGKSRLLYEFDVWSELWPDLFYFFKGRTNQEMQGQPYALIRNLLSFRFQIRDSDQVETVWEKMALGIGDALGEEGPTTAQMKAHFVGQLLGFDFSASPHLQTVLDDAKQIRDRALIYLGDYFKAMAAQNPVLILLEDLHWADESSLDMLNHLVLMMPDQPLLIVCTARPSLFERRPGWGEEQAFHAQLALRPLSEEDSRLLVGEILQRAERVPAALRELVVGGAEGNPFYVEELIKMLIEDGVILRGDGRWRVEPSRLVRMRVPPTLTSVLQARLDRLPAAERAALQQASVVGRIFWDRTVAHISASASPETGGPEIPTALSALQGREMVFCRDTSAFAGAQEYIFKHAILRDVTYESVLKRVRRVYHGLVAEWLTERSGGRGSEYTGLIADHMELAGKTEQAVVYLRRAGERAAAHYANAEAVNYFSRALALMPEADLVARYKLLLAREKLYSLQGAREDQVEDLAGLAELAEALADPRKQAEVALRWANYAQVTGDYSVATVTAKRAIDLAQQEISDSEAADRLMAQGHSAWGIALIRQGSYAQAQVHLERALLVFHRVGDWQQAARVLRALSIASIDQGRLAAAQEYLQQALHIDQEAGNLRGEGATLNNLGIVLDELGDYAQAQAYYQQALTISREVGDRRNEGMVLNNVGFISRTLGDYAQARAYYEQALHISQEIDDQMVEGGALNNLGDALHTLGEHAQALTTLQLALRISQKTGNRLTEGETLNNLGAVSHALGDYERAEAYYRQALALRQETGQQHYVAEDLAGLVQVALAQGEVAQAQAHVAEVLPILESNPILNGAEHPFRAILICYRVLQAGADARSMDALTNAHSLLQERATRISDEGMRQSFLENVPEHREIVSEWRTVNSE